jgi:hypothetical protein
VTQAEACTPTLCSDLEAAFGAIHYEKLAAMRSDVTFNFTAETIVLFSIHRSQGNSRTLTHPLFVSWAIDPQQRKDTERKFL